MNIDEFLSKIVTFSFNEQLLIINELNKLHKCDLTEINENNLKDNLLSICEELESEKLITRYNALSKLLLILTKQGDTNFLTVKDIEECFDLNYLQEALNIGTLDDLVKNLSYFYQKFLEINKEQINVKKMKLLFFIKINLILIFLFLYFLKTSNEIKYYVKHLSDEMEDILLRLMRLSSTHKYIPNRLVIATHYLFIKILFSELSDEDISTCRKIERKEKYLNKTNLDSFLKPTVPKFFYEFEKENNYIEKFYRKNMIKKDKSDIERVVIVNILKILLATIESSTTNDSIKDYVPEVILKYYINSSDDAEINIKVLLENLSVKEKENWAIIELLNKVSITAVIITFYYTILKQLQDYDLIQYTYFAFHLIDSNGLLVFLKILNLDFKSIENQMLILTEQGLIGNRLYELVEIIIYYNLKLIYKTCYKNEEYVQKFLIECKTHIMLRKILNNYSDSDKIKKNCLKLLKCQIKYMDRSWRIDNTNLILNIYCSLKLKNTDQIDNYLKYERKDKIKEASSEYLNNDELKKIHLEYHQNNYLRYLSQDEIEKYQNQNYQSLYANIYIKLLSMLDK
jgi:hypothetical protein